MKTYIVQFRLLSSDPWKNYGHYSYKSKAEGIRYQLTTFGPFVESQVRIVEV